jgi:cell division protein FtsW
MHPAATIRNDKSVVGVWWRSVDKLMLLAIAVLMGFGVVLVTAASPAVAEGHRLPPFHFVMRHIAMLIPSAAIMLWTSMLTRKTLWRVSTVVLLAAMGLMAVSILFGMQIKGATRWVHILGMSIQPSEFAKPAFAVAAAWLLARARREEGFPGFRLALGLYAAVLVLLLCQPDFGMSFVLTAIFGVEVFLSGVPLALIAGLGSLAAAGSVGAYLFFPHVASRVDRFLDPASGDNYQVRKSLEAFGHGGLFGTGPAHGQVKLTLPDAHADFIFAVAGEEFGLLLTVLLVLVFCFVLLRGVTRAAKSEDLFIVLGAGGLLTQFALQSLIHMGSSLQLLPAKGMTLPFISYGGSSLLSLGLGMGMLLALTRTRAETAAGGGAKKWRARENYA